MARWNLLSSRWEREGSDFPSLAFQRWFTSWGSEAWKANSRRENTACNCFLEAIINPEHTDDWTARLLGWGQVLFWELFLILIASYYVLDILELVEEEEWIHQTGPAVKPLLPSVVSVHASSVGVCLEQLLWRCGSRTAGSTGLQCRNGVGREGVLKFVSVPPWDFISTNIVNSSLGHQQGITKVGCSIHRDGFMGLLC